MVQIQQIRAFADNYIWMITDLQNKTAAVVDPGDARPVLKALEKQSLDLTAILITHHHADHTGGIRQLTQQFPGVTVFGPANENISGITQRLKEGNTIQLPGIQYQLSVIDVPGHTAGHIAYVNEQHLFCGDTLFAGGCGRVFDGTFEDLHYSLEKIAALPEQTLIYCAHEYTLDNLGFAKWVEPANHALLKRDQETEALCEKGVATVPSLLATELTTNPFLRVHNPVVIKAAEKFSGQSHMSPVSVFKAIRRWKDTQYD